MKDQTKWKYSQITLKYSLHISQTFSNLASHGEPHLSIPIIKGTCAVEALKTACLRFLMPFKESVPRITHKNLSSWRDGWWGSWRCHSGTQPFALQQLKCTVRAVPVQLPFYLHRLRFPTFGDHDGGGLLVLFRAFQSFHKSVSLILL